MTAQETIEQALMGEGCLGRSADDEPVFVLCARDPQAADLVREWAKRRPWHGSHALDPGVREQHAEKAETALDVAQAMDTWRGEVRR